jgi:hypothetical protein
MSYIINNTRGQIVAVVGDGTINTTATDLALVGRAVTNYGEYQNENYVYLLENFANPASPPQPILGQLWYNSSTDVINTYSSANAWIALATQDYVQAAKISPAFTGVPTAPTATTGTNTTQIATTAFVQNIKLSPAFTGVPTAPTATTGTNTTQVATTAFVQNEKSSPVFTGTPAAPTASVGTNNTQIATTAFVQLNKDSPAFTGTPTAPTAAANVANTQIATTAFVQTKIGALGTMSVQDAGAVAITGGTITGLSSAIPLASGGTGANTAADARTNLGLGTMATQSASNVQITGGSIFGLTSSVPLASGGTGANTAAGARTNLGLGSMATQNSFEVSITGGSILNSSFFNGTVTGLINPLAVVDGGTGATNVVGARQNLGLASGATTTVGTMAVQNASAVAITGGTITGIAPIAVAAGGTGASTASGARDNLGITSVFNSLGTMSSQNANTVTITGGTITGVVMAVTAGGTGATNAAAARTNLGLVIGTDVAPVASPAFTGIPVAPTAAVGTATTQLATTAFVTNSPQFAGVPVAPTAAVGTNTTQLATTAFVQSVVRALHPVGSIYTATVSTNPATLFGFGTWTQFAAGRMMMGAGGSFSPGTTGGSNDASVVSHTHTATSTDSGHVHSGALQTFSAGGQNASGAPNFINNINTGTGFANITTTVNATGVSGTNANLPPYIVVYMWQRTA